MKLERFGRIHGHRIFKSFTWPVALEDFGRFNLIYGWNGTGKTTLSGLFKSLQAGTDVFEGDVDFVVGDTSISGKSLSQSELPQVRVFNRDTVARSVFESSSDILGQLPPVYVFGEESAAKQQQLEIIKANLPALDDAVRKAFVREEKAKKDLDEFAASTARAIKNLLVAPGGSFNNYNAADYRQKISSFGTSPSPQLSPQERDSLVELKDAQPMPALPLSSVAFPDLMRLHQEAREALRRTVVSAVIDELAANPKVASWVSSGLPLHTGDDGDVCKFCNQPLPINRLRQLEAHFNDQFRQFTEGLTVLAERIEREARALDDVTLPESKDVYSELRSDYEAARSELKRHLGNVRAGLFALARAVQTKQQRVFESLELEHFLLGNSDFPEHEQSFLSKLLSVLTAGIPALAEFLGKKALDRLNGLLIQHNDITQSFSGKIKATRERLYLHELAVSLPDWNARKVEYDGAAEDHKAALKAKTDAEIERHALEEEIRDHRQPADELNRELVAYLGHDEIRVEVQDAGYRLIRRDGAATNLSEGERTAIAFLYFLKSLQDRSFDLKTSIVVVDDPISSLDTNAIYSAFGFMKRRLCGVGQLFVLTHNFTFFRQVRNWFNFINRGNDKAGLAARFYMLRSHYSDGVRSSALEVLDPFLRKYESEYHFLFKRILEASTFHGGASLQTYYELPNLARRLLEAFLVFKVPDQSSLHQRLEAIDFDGPKKTRIQRFVDTHSHFEQIAEGHDEASALAEAPYVLKDILTLIKECDEPHFTRMTKAIAGINGEG